MPLFCGGCMTEEEIDLMAKWKAQGWIPPSELPEYQKKFKESQEANWPAQQPKEKKDE